MPQFESNREKDVVKCHSLRETQRMLLNGSLRQRQNSEYTKHLSKLVYVYKAVKMVQGNWSGSDCNRSDTQPSVDITTTDELLA